MLLLNSKYTVSETWSAIIVVCETHLWPCMSTVLVMSLGWVNIVTDDMHASTMPNLDMHSRCNYFVCINLESSQKYILYYTFWEDSKFILSKYNYFHCVYNNIQILIATM